MTAPARIAAYRALRSITGRRADLPSALALSREGLPDERDRGLAADIITGTLRWQRSVDYLIEHFAKRRAAKVDPDILDILRLSLYQLLHLDRVPASAVVDDAVDLARYARKPSATAFVNAVLRSMLRERHRLPLPPPPGATTDRAGALAYLGITHSHPEWLVSRWLDRHGFDAAERWVRFNNHIPRLTLRVNTLGPAEAGHAIEPAEAGPYVPRRREEVAAALAGEGIETKPTRYAPDGLIVTSGNPLRTPSTGAFLVQDEASQLVSLAVAARPGDRVLDLCASPGGKTVALAADIRDTGMVVASDVRTPRVRLLRQTIETSGAARVSIVHVGASAALPFMPRFDRVLVDAPCSGLGTIRRDPDIRWRREERDLPVFAREQATLLHRAADVVSRGGRLVYATCSSEPEENEAVVDEFLSTRDDFLLVDLRNDGSRLAPPLLDRRGMMRTLPFAHGLEAFFAAALVRRGTI